MTTTTAAATAAASTEATRTDPPVRLWPLSLDRWHAMLEAGAPRPAHPSAAPPVVEVPVTSVAHDRGREAAVYTRAALPEHRVVDVPAGRVEVRTRSEDGEYRELHTLGRGEVLVPTTVQVPPLSVADLLA